MQLEFRRPAAVNPEHPHRVPPDDEHERAVGGLDVLAVADALQGAPNIWALAADTDGIDGSEQNAGAIAAPAATLTL